MDKMKDMDQDPDNVSRVSFLHYFVLGGVVVLRYSVGLVSKRSRVRVLAGHYGVKKLWASF